MLTLARDEDPGVREAEHRIGPVDAELPFDERLMDVWRYQRRQEAAEPF
ncbi:hypothetical protein ABT373_30010 [Streptomyces sp. NPDC000070]